MLILIQSRTNQDPSLFEDNWSPILESMLGEISIQTLQCYVLAQMYCLTKGDYSSLLRYRSLATGLCHQLRLHQSQKAFSSNPLLAETRKKVFWCQYVVDRCVSHSAIFPRYPANIRSGSAPVLLVYLFFFVSRISVPSTPRTLMTRT
jgi:hypothetical protein